MLEFMKQEPCAILVIAPTIVICAFIVFGSMVDISANIAKAIMYKKESK